MENKSKDPKSKNEDKKMGRKEFLKKAAIGAMAASGIFGLAKFLVNEESGHSQSERTNIPWYDYEKVKAGLDFRFKQIYPDLHIENINMLGEVSKYGATTTEGKILRSLRFKNITEAVEDKYNLPRNLILAMVMEESTGVDLLPNAGDDGGFGLCHMQGSVAKEFGLKTFENCHELVCNEGHAKRLRKKIEEANYDRAKLINLDDRLHPILNLDAAGRILASNMSKPASPKLKDLSALELTICRYAGAHNFRNYLRDILINMKLLGDEEELRRVSEHFNKLNPNLRIDGDKADFDTYIEQSLKQNYNYSLESYKNGKKYLPKHSQQVLKDFK